MTSTVSTGRHERETALRTELRVSSELGNELSLLLLLVVGSSPTGSIFPLEHMLSFEILNYRFEVVPADKCMGPVPHACAVSVRATDVR